MVRSGKGKESSAFEAAYKGLNEAQKAAVDHVEGPVMVIAGPGTGKTQILTLRIAAILQKTDTAPENILALTFTEAAAQNMRRRLAALIGNPAYQVRISTFHGFCNDVIRRFPEDFPRVVGSRAIADVDQVSMVEEIIMGATDPLPLVLLRPFGDRLLYVRDIVSALGELKREGITPEKFATLIEAEKNTFQSLPDLYHTKGPHTGKMKGEYIQHERLLLKNEELLRVYVAYQNILSERKLYDFSDMILEVLTTLEQNQTLLQLLQEEHQYVLVDEHQDTNNAQNRILELLMSYHDRPNLFVVGDEKQAIFRFQGASLENFDYVKKRYAGVTLITLTQNYRSTQTVLDAGSALLPALLQKNTSYAEHPIQIGGFHTPAEERYFISHAIEKKITDGIAPGDIAILYRNNKDAFPIGRDLARLGIPYHIESDQDLFAQGDVGALLRILKAVCFYGDDLLLAELLHLSLFSIDPLDAYKLLRNAAERKKYSLYDLLTNEALLLEISLADPASIFSLGRKLTAWARQLKEKELLSFFEYIVRDSGLLATIVASENAGERFDALGTLFDQVRALREKKADATLVDFFIFLETIQKHKLFIRRTSQLPSDGKVRLMTVHKSKGLEFSHVYIMGAVHGVFGGKSSRDRLPLIPGVYGGEKEGRDTDEDERRLMYVALTRAKESVTITYATEDDTHREMLPSAFLEEIPPPLIERIDTDIWKSAYAADASFSFAEEKISSGTGSSSPSLKNEEAFVKGLFEKQGLSPTALNNYVECPWKYFYLNLIRIPQSQTIHQHYGIAVHAALQDFYTHMKHEGVSGPFLLESFKRHLFRQPLSERDLELLLEKGTAALSGWFKTYDGSWDARVSTEFRINGVLLEGVKLTGVLDKLEYIDNTIVEVVDYKTAKPKTRNELLGKTKSANGNYYRQLVFYKLLLEEWKEGFLSMQRGTIDFVEPDEKGIYHRESFEIDSTEVAELRALIATVSEEIQSLSFWNKKCDDATCEYCALRSLMTR